MADYGFNRFDYLQETPSQTAGPYLHIGLTPAFAGIEGVYDQDFASSMVIAETAGEPIFFEGQIFDGKNEPIKDALIEIWQADAQGIYPSRKAGNAMIREADPAFFGWGRQAVSEEGFFCFETIRPGSVLYPDGRIQAPHISCWIVARGINMGLHTRAYFSDQEGLNQNDPLLNSIPSAVRRHTLIAQKKSHNEKIGFRFDIHLQGENETVFLDM